MNAVMRGISLLEIMVALAVLAIGMVALIKFQANLMTDRNLASQQSVAIALARDRIDMLRHFEVVPVTSGKSSYDGIVPGTAVVSGVSASYTVAWSVINHTNPAHKLIHITVSWTDQKGASQQIQLDSIIARVDPAKGGEAVQSI
jgi:Tfp pilus assembly protein PilV